MHLSRVTGWYPWIAQDARDIDHTPYAHRQVEIAREEWDIPETVDPRALNPLTNGVDLWWRPLEPGVASTHHDAALRAFAVWYLHASPTAASSAVSAWQILAASPEGRATQAMWHAIAQAVMQEEDTP